jgi:hypothetical protein
MMGRHYALFCIVLPMSNEAYSGPVTALQSEAVFVVLGLALKEKKAGKKVTGQRLGAV